MSDPPVSVCETCGAGPVEKVLFPVAVHFKGSGFYATDYGRGSRKSSKDGDSSATSTDGGGAASEKPAAAAEAKKSDSSKPDA